MQRNLFQLPAPAGTELATSGPKALLTPRAPLTMQIVDPTNGYITNVRRPRDAAPRADDVVDVEFKTTESAEEREKREQKARLDEYTRKLAAMKPAHRKIYDQLNDVDIYEIRQALLAGDPGRAYAKAIGAAASFNNILDKLAKAAKQ